MRHVQTDKRAGTNDRALSLSVERESVSNIIIILREKNT
jgi:hypothetical protein